MSGVGRVTERVVPVEQFMVTGPEGKQVPITEVPGLMVARTTKSTEDPEKAEYLVRVKWDETVPESQAIKERGFFGVQHTVARPEGSEVGAHGGAFEGGVWDSGLKPR